MKLIENITHLDDSFLRYKKIPITIRAKQMEEPFLVKTLEGVMEGDAGDYLVIGIKGEIYPVKREIFEQTYEDVANQ